MWTALLDPDRLRASLPDQPLPYAAAQERLTGGAVGAGAERVALGTSREGRPLELERFGDGPCRALWYAGPHANEVAGVATVVALAERLAAEPALLDGPVGVDLLLCVDPDAYVRNEAWFGAEIDMTAYYRHFHRPAMDEWPTGTSPSSTARCGGRRACRRPPPCSPRSS